MANCSRDRSTMFRSMCGSGAAASFAWAGAPRTLDCSSRSVGPKPEENAIEFRAAAACLFETPAVAHDDDAVGKGCFAAAMGCDQQRAVAGALHRAFEHVACRRAVQTLARLVEQPDFGVAQEKPGQCKSS